VSVGNLGYGLCADFTTVATGVVAADYAILEGPSNAGWTASAVSTGINTIVVRVCNVTGAAANPNGFTIDFLAIR
jgi:hypothetical protein